MPSRVTIFDRHSGYAIAELTVSTTRSWMLDNFGRCQFTMATFTDPNCNRSILQYGNFILVEHIPTQDTFGNFRGTLPPWIGVILPPQQWDFGLITVTAYSVEDLLSYRPMPYVTLAGHPGQVFSQIINFSNQLGGFPIQVGTVYDAPPGTTQNLQLSAFEELKTLSQAFNQDWNVTYQLSTNKQLSLFANWYFQEGVVVNSVFSEGINGNMKYPKLTEQGNIGNIIFGYNSASSKGTRLQNLEIDPDSVSDYGRLGLNKNFNVQGQDAVNSATQSFLSQNSRPIITLELTALDEGQTYTGLSVGNIWNVVLNSVGFYGGKIGFQGQVRLTGIEYDDWTNEAKLTTQVLTAGLIEANYA